MKEELYISTKVCPACGKNFAISCLEKDWAYHFGGARTAKCVCSWTCVRASERLTQKKTVTTAKEKRKIYTDSVSCKLVAELIEYMEYLEETSTYMARLMGIKPKTVFGWMKGTSKPNEVSRKRIEDFLEKTWRKIK